MQVQKMRYVPLPLAVFALAAVIAATGGSCSRIPTQPTAGTSATAAPAGPVADAIPSDRKSVV